MTHAMRLYTRLPSVAPAAPGERKERKQTPEWLAARTPDNPTSAQPEGGKQPNCLSQLR